jgi:hypothetical protein
MLKLHIYWFNHANPHNIPSDNQTLPVGFTSQPHLMTPEGTDQQNQHYHPSPHYPHG